MGGTQRLAAVAAVSHARHYYNRTQEDDSQPYEPVQFNVNVFFASATLCGVVLAVCLACWRRAVDSGKPDPDLPHSDIYTVSAEIHNAYQIELVDEKSGGVCAVARPGRGLHPAVGGHRLKKKPMIFSKSDILGAAAGPPPAYDAVVKPPDHARTSSDLEGVVTESCPRCHAPPVGRSDSGLPSYEAAVLLRDTKL